MNLDAPAHYIHWGLVLISVPNLIVIGLMIAVFLLALVVPMPGHGRRGRPSGPRR